MGDRMRVLVLSNALMAVVGATAAAVAIFLLNRAFDTSLLTLSRGDTMSFPPEFRDRLSVAISLAIATALVLIIGGCAMLLRIIGPLWRRTVTSEAWTEAVVSNVAEGILIINAEQLIQSFNPACQAIFGYAAADVVGGPLKLLVPSDADHPLEKLLSTLFSSQKTAKQSSWCETIGRRRNGETFPLEMSINPMATGNPALVALVIRDVTKRQQADQKLQHHVKLLRESYAKLETKSNELKNINQELEEFTYLASHDLKEPLRGIGAYCEILHEDYHTELDEEGKERLDTLVRLCGRLERLIDDLLRYTRVGFCRPNCETVALDDEIQDVLATLRPTIERRRARIRVAPLPVVSCDPTLVGEVFRNLIVNAMKFNRRQPEVRIGFLDRPQPVLFVRDNGIGISREHHESIFEMFRRLHARQHYEGTGAGLSIVRKIIDGHQGRIWLESQPGVGTTFYFTLGVPITDDKEDEAASSNSVSPGRPADDLSIPTPVLARITTTEAPATTFPEDCPL